MPENSDMSDYEIKEATRFMSDVYNMCVKNLDRDEWFGEAWITYLEIRKECGGKIYLFYDWGEFYNRLKRVTIKIKRERNARISLESELSLNASYGENGPMVETWFPRTSGDFVNQIALWDYIVRLGNDKYKILKLMSQREDDFEIMKKLRLSVQEYSLFKLELRFDFQKYLECR